MNFTNSGVADILRTAYYIHGPESMKLIFAVLCVPGTMGLTRCVSFVWQLVRELLKKNRYRRHFQDFMKEEKFANSERYKINENIYTPRNSNMVVRIGCNLSY